MSKLLYLVILICLITALTSGQKKELNAGNEFRKYLLAELSQTHLKIDQLPKKKSTQLIDLFKEARQHYKHVEFFVEYYSPREAKYFINGPALSKYDEFDHKFVAPRGFQKIEEIIFNSAKKIDKTSLTDQCKLLSNALSNLLNYYRSVEISDGLLLEMSQLQLVRIATLNLNGYDATLSLNNIQETLWCLEGIEVTLSHFQNYLTNESRQANFDSLTLSIQRAKSYLEKNNSYKDFNRLEFIVNHINSLNKSLIKFHNNCNIPWRDTKQAINLKQEFLFGEESFNKQFFSIYYLDTVNLKKQSKLGKLLFYDPVLSGNGSLSCSSCHNPSNAFTEETKALENGAITRNIPTLLNVAYQKAFFYDGRAYQLEQQVFDVIHNKNEMNSTLEDISIKLLSKPSYKVLFEEAFKGTIHSKITPYAIQKVISEYEKTLVSFDSRFDKYIKGDLTSLTKQEVSGYNIFSGKALCGSCHFMPLFNGTVPPLYNDSEFEVIGVAEDSKNLKLDTDTGRYLVTGFEEHLFSFKTPTLRNIELTSPYMHNGAYETLEEVVEFYNKGGGVGLGFSLPHQTLPFDSLQLTETEKQNIVAFLKTLTGTTQN